MNSSMIDDHYRYRMEAITVKFEGNVNGLKTVVPNIFAIAKAIDRPLLYLGKYFSYRLGVQTILDNNRFVLKGRHEASKLQQILDSFIKAFVLCDLCENPETALSLKKNLMAKRCKACGFNSIINSCDKMTCFIVKDLKKQL